MEYVFNKQTVRELAETHNKDRRTIKRYLDKYQPSEKIHHPRKTHLVVDATYFGDPKEDTDWCVIVFRDRYGKEDLWWSYEKTETTSAYRKGRDFLESLGYIILSVTGDGFGGIRTAFYGIPYQMCHVHMERLLRKGTTQNPKTEAGKTLRALTLSLFGTDSNTFKRRYQAYLLKYADFLNEKTINPETGRSEWTHDRLRTASMSLIHHLPYLFTYETNRRIPRTTNSLEARWRHINEVTAIHCGLSQQQKEKLLTTLLLTSTISPSESLLEKVFKNRH